MEHAGYDMVACFVAAGTWFALPLLMLALLVLVPMLVLKLLVYLMVSLVLVLVLVLRNIATSLGGHVRHAVPGIVRQPHQRWVPLGALGKEVQWCWDHASGLCCCVHGLPTVDTAYLWTSNQYM
jgi:hypothetical protein